MSGEPARNIFISYRRKDAVAYAGRLNDNLKHLLGGGTVFMDYEAIDPGADFGDVIESSLANCQMVVVVIGPDWEGAGEEGARRIDNPDDWVRKEVAAVLDRDIPVIPALVGGRQMPEDLPAEIGALGRRNAIKLDDDDWDDDVKRLVRFIRKTLDLPEEEPAAAAGSKAAWHAGLPPWLKVSGALVAGIGGLLGAVKTGIEIKEMLAKDETGEETVAEERATASGQVMAADVLPFGLINAMELDPREGAPYWLQYSVENTGSRPITIEVRGQVLSGKPFRPADFDTKLPPLEPGGKIVNERVNFPVQINEANFRSPEGVAIEWYLQDEHQDRLVETSKTIRFLPRNTLKWDLELPDKTSIPRDYLLASLAAWVLHDPDTLLATGREITRAAVDSAESGRLVDAWLEECFTRLFGPGSALRLDPANRGLIPTDNELRIKTPTEMLKGGGLVNPLEAVLLVAALAREELDERAHFGMFGYAEEGSSRIDKFLLGWTDPDHGSWSAFDLTQWAADSDFEAIKLASTASLTGLLGDGGPLQSLESTGVFFDDPATLAAIEFETAQREYGIYSLP